MRGASRARRAPRRSSRAAAAALIIAYSPDTWYAASGSSNAVAHEPHDVEVRHAPASPSPCRRPRRRRARPRAAPRASCRGPSGSPCGPGSPARRRRALGRVAERTVERARELRGVGEDGHVVEAVAVERRADGGHPAVHHVRGRDDVGAGPRVRRRPRGRGAAASRRCRPSPAGPPASAVEDAAVAVVGVLAQADVGDHDELGDRLLDRADRLLRRCRPRRRRRVPVASLCSGMPKRMTDADAQRRTRPAPRRRARPPRAGRRPASTSPAFRTRAPGSTNSGQTRSSGARAVSRTRLRSASLRRMRRGRSWGKGMASFLSHPAGFGQKPEAWRGTARAAHGGSPRATRGRSGAAGRRACSSAASSRPRRPRPRPATWAWGSAGIRAGARRRGRGSPPRPRHGRR